MAVASCMTKPASAAVEAEELRDELRIARDTIATLRYDLAKARRETSAARATSYRLAQPKPVEGPVRFALQHLWDIATTGVDSIEVRAPRIREVIATYLPHERQPTPNGVTRIGRQCQAGRIPARLDDGVSYSYSAGVFTVKRDRA